MTIGKKGWQVADGENKCRVKPSIDITPEMEARRVELDRTRLGNYDYVTYYDPETEVYWAEKIAAS